MKYYIDSEFAGHLGHLISFAIVREDYKSLYCITNDSECEVDWVNENVLPVLHTHACEDSHLVDELTLGSLLRDFLKGDSNVNIISDSMSDIIYFAKLVTTDTNGEYKPYVEPMISFTVENIEYLNERAVAHNAWCDAIALMHAIESLK